MGILKKYCIILFTIISLQTHGKEIILIRHAKVNIGSNGWMFPRKAIQLRTAYDTASIHQFPLDSIINSLPVRTCDTIYTSNLSRSISTAYLLFGDSVNYFSTSLFNEFQLKILRLPLVLPFKAWTSLSRFGWFLGIKRDNSENISDARKRTKIAVDFIENKSNYSDQIILVTHGFLNRNLKKELKKRGWELIRNDGHKNLGANRLIKD